MFVAAADGGRHADSSTDSSDYTNLADDDIVASGLQDPVKTCAAGSVHDVSDVSGKPLDGLDRQTTYRQSDVVHERTHSCPTNVLVNGLTRVHRPTVLLTRRRKRASLAASAIVRSIQQNGECRLVDLPSDGRQPSKSDGCGPRTVVLYRDCLDGHGSASSDDFPSLESLDAPGLRSSDGGDTVVCCEKPFSSQDDGYCTAKSGVAVPLACCQRLSKITSSSEVDSSADGVFLQDVSDSDDSSSVSALPRHCASARNDTSNFFGCPPVSRVLREYSHRQSFVSQTELLGLVDSSDPETDVGDVDLERHCSWSSPRPFSRHSSLPLSSVVVRTCSLPMESAENHQSGPAADSFGRHSVCCEVDRDVQQAIDMFAFLDHQESPANAASSASR